MDYEIQIFEFFFNIQDILIEQLDKMKSTRINIAIKG